MTYRKPVVNCRLEPLEDCLMTFFGSFSRKTISSINQIVDVFDHICAMKHIMTEINASLSERKLLEFVL